MWTYLYSIWDSEQYSKILTFAVSDDTVFEFT